MAKIIIILFLTICLLPEKGQANDSLLPEIDIYKIDISSVENFDIIKKGTNINAILENNLSSQSNSVNDSISLQIPNESGEYISANGLISMSSEGKRFSKYSTLQLSTNKAYLNDGREVYLSSTSPILQGIHPPHINSSTLALANTITSLSLATSPATLGTSLGISFLINGLLSARQNGISDFIWGGFSGSGLSFVEKMIRKQPDIYLPSGTEITFTLNDDCKISKGIKKEKIETLTLSNEDAAKKIQQLIQWGDLSGALELSVKTGQKETYKELLNKIVQ